MHLRKTPGINRNFDLSVLSAAQTVMMMTSKITLMVTGLLAISFGVNPKYATIPAVFMLLGTPLGSAVCPWLFKRFSRVDSFIFNLLIMVISCVIVSFAIVHKSFTLLDFACIFIGIHRGIARYYQYTAADLFVDNKARPISYIILAGVPSAIFGPILAEKTHLIFHQYPFLATYIAVAILNLIVLLLFVPVNLFPAVAAHGANDQVRKRSRKEALMQRSFIVGTITTGVCYLVMAQIMVATPIAMRQIYHYSLGSIALAMQLHFLGMFSPSLLTPKLIKYFGTRWIMLLGVVIYFSCVVVILSGTTQMHFYIGLLLLGIGWNFIFIVGTSLVAASYHSHERNLIQGMNNVITSLFTAGGALLAGPLLFSVGWLRLNELVLPGCVLLLLCAFFIHSKNNSGPV